MKRSYSQGFVTKHHGYWRAVLSWQEQPGAQHKLTKSTGVKCYPDRIDKDTGERTPDNRGKATAETFLRKWRDELVSAEEARETLEAANDPMTFSEHAESFIMNKELSCSVRSVTAKGYRSYLNKITGAPIGNMHICEIAPRDIMAWEQGLLADGISVSTLSHIHVFAKQVFESAHKMGEIKSNPFALVDAPKRRPKPVNSLTKAGVVEMNRALAGFGVSPLAVGAKLALMTGMRQAEICALRWRDVDLDNREIRVTHSLTRASGHYVIARPKTESSIRNIPFGSSLSILLTRRMREMRGEREEFGMEWDDDLFVIGSPVSCKPYSPQVLGREWHTFARTIGLIGTQGEFIRFHDLRHTFATLAISSASGNVDVKTVSVILGHSSAAFTLNVYSDALAESKRDGMEKIDGLLS